MVYDEQRYVEYVEENGTVFSERDNHLHVHVDNEIESYFGHDFYDSMAMTRKTVYNEHMCLVSSAEYTNMAENPDRVSITPRSVAGNPGRAQSKA